MLCIGYALLNIVSRKAYFVQILLVLDSWIVRQRWKHIDITRHVIISNDVFITEKVAIRFFL